jgi:hypothetical protein
MGSPYRCRFVLYPSDVERIMYARWRFFPALAMAAAALIQSGCGGGGGSPGDSNDPATTTDLEVMADETDVNLQNGQLGAEAEE